jgi:hypothetical protein
MKNEKTCNSFLYVNLTAKTWIQLLLPVIHKANTWIPLLPVILSECSESKDLVVKDKDPSAALGMTEYLLKEHLLKECRMTLSGYTNTRHERLISV